MPEISLGDNRPCLLGGQSFSRVMRFGQVCVRVPLAQLRFGLAPMTPTRSGLVASSRAPRWLVFPRIESSITCRRRSADHPPVHFFGEHMDLAGDVGVGL